jgi:hypothetical protein
MPTNPACSSSWRSQLKSHIRKRLLLPARRATDRRSRAGGSVMKRPAASALSQQGIVGRDPHEPEDSALAQQAPSVVQGRAEIVQRQMLKHMGAVNRGVPVRRHRKALGDVAEEDIRRKERSAAYCDAANERQPSKAQCWASIEVGLLRRRREAAAIMHMGTRSHAILQTAKARVLDGLRTASGTQDEQRPG